MSGFGWYETLRILVPGATAAGVLALVLRFAGGGGPALGDGPFEGVIGVLEGATFVAVSLAAGFLLYLIDLPQRSRLGREGDPGNGIQMPSVVLGRLLGPDKADEWIRSKSFPLYFLLTDAHLPQEFHRRVYFFGSIYRIYADARYLTTAGVALGVPVALLANGNTQPPWIGGAQLGLAALCILTLAVAGAAGEVGHASSSIAKRRRESDTTPYAEGLARSLSEVFRVTLVIALVEAVGLILAGQTPAVLQVFGMMCCLAAYFLWGTGEIGPPSPRGPAVDFRGVILRKLRVPNSESSQFTPAQRALMDLALLGPAVVGAAVATQQQGRGAIAVLLWMTLALPATLIMSVRKHEQRWLNGLKDQTAWLEINANNLDDLRANALRRGTWA